MKTFRIAALLLTTLFALVTACNDGPADTGAYNDPYTAFSTEFASSSPASITALGGGSFTVAFGAGFGSEGGRFVTLDPATTRVFVCRPASWPALTVSAGRWLIDGADSGVALTTDPAREQIVAVIADGQGIYVRLSSGGMFYFFDTRSSNVGCFRFERALNPGLEADVVCNLKVGNIIEGDIGALTPGTALIPTFGCRGTLTTEAGVELTSSVSQITSALGPQPFTLRQGDKSYDYTLTTIHGIDIPVLRIDTGGQGAPTSKETYISAAITIEDPDLLFASKASETIYTEIRGRGNSTWGMPKKPYKLKLAKKQRLLGMSDNRHWCLMANYSDKALLRNCLAFWMAQKVGMSWAPRWVPVELYMNGEYLGQYMLTEQIRTADERIEMTLAGPEDNEGEALTGGYLFCIDEKDLDPSWGPTKVGFYHVNASGSSFPVAFDEPEEPTTAQQEYARGLFREIEDAIYNRSLAEIDKVLDVESLIDFWIVNELSKNADSNMRLSTYLAKPRGQRMYFATVWDFDISFGNIDYMDCFNTSGWFTREAVWIRQMFRNQEFCDLVARRWREFYPSIAAAGEWTWEWAAKIDRAQKRNFERWPILGIYVWPNYMPETRKTYTAEVTYMLDFLNRRAAWMNGEITAGRHKLQ